MHVDFAKVSLVEERGVRNGFQSNEARSRDLARVKGLAALCAEEGNSIANCILIPV